MRIALCVYRWNLARRQTYLEWTEQVVAGCRGANPRLDAICDHVLREGRAILESQPLHAPDA